MQEMLTEIRALRQELQEGLKEIRSWQNEHLRSHEADRFFILKQKDATSKEYRQKLTEHSERIASLYRGDQFNLRLIAGIYVILVGRILLDWFYTNPAH